MRICAYREVCVCDTNDQRVAMASSSTDPCFVYLDLETTGFSPTNDRIIEIAAMTAKHGEYVTLVDPGRKLPERIVELTGITDKHLHNAPTFQAALRGLIQWLCALRVRLPEDTKIIMLAWNGRSFDFKFLHEQMRRLGYEKPSLPVDGYADPLLWHRWAYPEEKKHGLGKAYELVVEASEARPMAHRALGDCQMMCRVVESATEAFDPFDKRWFQDNLVL